jgi:hypothetical protein
MTDQFLIRPAHEGDCEFIAGLVPSLLEFGSQLGTTRRPSLRGSATSLSARCALKTRDQLCWSPRERTGRRSGSSR